VLGDVLLLVGVLAVLVFAFAPSLNDDSDLGLALVLCLWGQHTGKPLDFFKPYDTFKFVMQV
jgi:hypothetical protein